MCVKFGLFNGAVGTVEDVLYLNGRKHPALPDVVMIEVPNYSGPPFITEIQKLFQYFQWKEKLNAGVFVNVSKFP